MASISSLGVGSGLDLSSILDSLTAAQKATLTPISNQQSSFTAKLSAYGTLKSALTTFQTANTALSKADLFSATSTTSSTTAFSATTAGNAIAGKYTISVTHLAQAQTLTTRTTRDDTKTAIATSDSKLTIQQGGDKDPITIDISAANSSLSGIRDAINNAKAGVSASIINVGNGEYRLSVTSNDTGLDNAMTLSVSGDDALQSFMGYDASASSNGMEVSVAAQNAQLTVNNVAIENSSNTISDALENITLNLNDVTTGNQTLTITQDTSKAQTAIKDWVNAYNSLIDTFSSLTKYTAVDAGADSQSSSNGALLGDSTLRTIQTQLKSMLSNTVSSSSYKTLAQIGITTDPSDGKLELDADKLTAALKKDASGVGALIVGDGKKTGITTTIGSNLTSWLSTTGIIKAATDGVSKTLNKLTKDYNAASDRIDAQVARYKEQFTQLDVLMTSLNSTSSYLTQQFENNSNSKQAIFIGRQVMYAAKGTQAYAQIGVESAVMSASQQQLVTMLFDGVLSALVRASLFMQDNNQQGKGVSLSKAINIIENGLRVSLDEESKDELTQNLIALYSYMVRRLLQANLRNDVSAVEEVEALMRNIADAWKESLLSPSLIQDPV